MRREVIPFDMFKEHFITHPDGYFPVYSAFQEADGKLLRVVEMDMICEWRLADAKVKFIAVSFRAEEQLEEIVAYLKTAADSLNKSILKGISELKFSETTK